MTGADILDPTRSMMKVYAARDYKDDKYRSTNMVEINLPEYTPTVPQDGEYTELVLPPSRDYFFNINFPETQEKLKENHFVQFPLMHGTICPVRFNKGAQFLLFYPTGKIDEGFLVFLRDVENQTKEGGA